MQGRKDVNAAGQRQVRVERTTRLLFLLSPGIHFQSIRVCKAQRQLPRRQDGKRGLLQVVLNGSVVSLPQESRKGGSVDLSPETKS